jgi:hypothetical protein
MVGALAIAILPRYSPMVKSKSPLGAPGEVKV